MSDKISKTRVNVTMTKIFVDALDRLVREGVYMDRGDAIRDAVRLLLHVRGITPFIIGKLPPEEAEKSPN